MPIKHPVSDKPLTREEFADKYWLNGEHPYQYHTLDIEDGRDEVEQLIINNIRATWEALDHPLTLLRLKSADLKGQNPKSE